MSEYQPGLEGVPATKSKISYLDGKQGILTYRGYPIVEHGLSAVGRRVADSRSAGAF
jgi:citrate synthase